MDDTEVTHTRPAATAAQRQALGAYGERLAATHLSDQGMVVLERNFRCTAGEIDLVLRQGETLVICEVKTRTSEACGSPLEAVDEHKHARLRRLAALWLEAHPAARPADVRIDLVGVTLPTRGQPRIDHVVGVG
ncbi:MAG: YraN family protein [Nocardioides sp.]